jgi:hypothetical protein
MLLAKGWSHHPGKRQIRPSSPASGPSWPFRGHHCRIRWDQVARRLPNAGRASGRSSRARNGIGCGLTKDGEALTCLRY